MKRTNLKPLVWPVAVLIASALTALAAEATAHSAETVGLYGMIKVNSDLLLLIGATMLVVALVRIVMRRSRGRG
ncbi:hypothetical protein [uncultured Brevundimonas sp.]|uniref:hypothetical protein n=1 Tax=uncultured Brevundimonas sp. TaxID=213418 RepID=UPI0025F13B41|nr:hypothetical protein [uncultured Brevundimonas sp.]